jgi:hypothetical protein
MLPHHLHAQRSLTPKRSHNIATARRRRTGPYQFPFAISFNARFSNA